MNDFWSMSGSFIYRHHVEPRVNLYSPREESFPIPLKKYIDVSRTTHTKLDVKQEKRIDDYWNIDGSRDLYDYWTGFTQFTLFDEKALDGYTWSRKRLTRNSLHPRQITYGQNSGAKWERNAKLKENQKWSHENFNSITHENCEGSISSTRRTNGVTRGKSNEIKSKLACNLEASESTRLHM